MLKLLLCEGKDARISFELNISLDLFERLKRMRTNYDLMLHLLGELGPHDLFDGRFAEDSWSFVSLLILCLIYVTNFFSRV